MRQFLNTLFVLSEDAYLSLDGENVVVSRGKAEVGRVPLHTLESILCFSYAGASPALMGKCGRMGIDLSFYSPRGRFLARTVGEERGNVLLRQTQYAVAASEALSCSYARSFILGKVYNARWVLERDTRDHPQRVPVDELKQTSAQLAAALPLVESCEDLEQLRGLEGEAAQREGNLPAPGERGYGFGAPVVFAEQQRRGAADGKERAQRQQVGTHIFPVHKNAFPKGLVFLLYGARGPLVNRKPGAQPPLNKFAKCDTI